MAVTQGVGELPNFVVLVMHYGECSGQVLLNFGFSQKFLTYALLWTFSVFRVTSVIGAFIFNDLSRGQNKSVSSSSVIFSVKKT